MKYRNKYMVMESLVDKLSTEEQEMLHAAGIDLVIPYPTQYGIRFPNGMWLAGVTDKGGLVVVTGTEYGDSWEISRSESKEKLEELVSNLKCLKGCTVETVRS